MPKLGWFDSLNLDNQYCGKDGGSYIRIPLLRELNRRGWQIDFEGYDPGNYYYTEEGLFELGILEEAYRFRDSIDFVNHRSVNLSADDYDIIIVEARSSEFSEYERQLDIIDAADCDCYVLDRNNWARDMPAEYRNKVTLLRPYDKPNEHFESQVYFPYWYDSNCPRLTVEPRYDLVYVGNRWGRRDEMWDFLSAIEDFDVCMCGNWTMREPEMVEEFDMIDWIGPIPHFAVVPTLALGKATFHVGKPDYNELGFYTMRTYEARMAGRPCLHDDSMTSQPLDDRFYFSNPADLDPDVLYDYYQIDVVRTEQEAAEQLCQLR